jgi:hypothetical protein
VHGIHQLVGEVIVFIVRQIQVPAYPGSRANEASTVRSSDYPNAKWRKSSYSNDGGQGECVEVAGLPDRVAMRDSKDPAGPVLACTRAE